MVALIECAPDLDKVNAPSRLCRGRAYFVKPPPDLDVGF